MSKDRTRTYDALIVGGGVIGLASAWRAARRGLRVCVLERGDRLASGATGIAAGMLAPVGEASWGEEPLLQLGLTSLGMWDRFASELEADSGASAGFRRCGALHVALDRDEAEALRRRHQLHQRLELASEWLRPAGSRELEPGIAPAISAGLHAPHEAVVAPVVLCDALAAALTERGGAVELGAEVVAAVTEEEEGSARVTLADGRELEAANLVVASGAWSGASEWLAEDVRPPVRPVKGQILTLRGPEPVCERIVSGELVYLVPREDGHLIVGATMEERGFDTTVTAGAVHELLREAYRVLPEIAELELVHARAGLRPGTPDNAPLIGRLEASGPLFATGHHRNGVLLAPVTAEAVAGLLAGQEPGTDIEPYSPARFLRRGDRPGVTRTEVGTR